MTKRALLQHLDCFTRAYIECALWSSTAYGHPNERKAEADGRQYDSSFQDENFDADDLSLKALREIVADCKAFQSDNHDDLYALPTPHGRWTSDEQAGHDFWLTRNGHGAGFWDRGNGALGERLAAAARVYGEVDLYYHRGRIWS